MRRIFLLLLMATGAIPIFAQTSFPVNGVADIRHRVFAFTHATIYKDGANPLSDATLVIREGNIEALGANVSIPKEAVVIDCSGKSIYPSFIDIYSDYGMPALPPVTRGFNFFGPAQINSNQRGAYGWNQALKADVDASKLFAADDAKAKPLREVGFGAVLSHQKDGIARGTGVVVSLANKKENLVLIRERASAHYSFSKGTSGQSYPTSMMGSIALLRQTYLDAQWYKSRPASEGTNLTLQAWNDNQSLPQIFDANDKWNDLRADRVGDEFGVQYIIKGSGNEYQRIKEIAATKASFILPLNFPQAMDIEDPNDARFVSLGDMKHWELAPTNPAAFEKAGISFCLTAADNKDVKQFMTNLRKAIDYGLSENKAYEALTKTPATLLGIYDKVGSLDAGKLANFIISSGSPLNEKTIIYQNWIQGEKYMINEAAWNDVKGTYAVTAQLPTGNQTFAMEVKEGNNISVTAKDTVNGKISYDGKLVKFSFPESKKSKNTFRFSGVNNEGVWQGTGEDSSGRKFLWTATMSKKATPKADTAKKKEPVALGKVTYPFNGYGWEELPKAENLLIKNATVWTNEKEGKLENTDVLVKNGKIAQIGKNLSDATAKVIDATGKHLTPGIIDEHSHIAAASINEGAQSVTSEVRIGDNLYPDDINIYRQLSGGVTSSHILHGSANTIGGQTQLIKLRWGADDNGLKFAGADPFIKFALGENVKRSPAQQNTRFPDTRMGVEEVMADAFQRAKDYEAAWKAAGANTSDKKQKGGAPDVVTPVRRDLELDALVEILNNKRFITCHSYVQSEITAALRVADKYGFHFNTFTHILEGYKVADKMKERGANASTFSDWWLYKMEVVDAIPYNPYIMTKMGLNVAINSDDAEMARRLNQEAAKSVKYGGLTEEEALKMVTLNPATMLHVQDHVGSIKVGKDADLVVWSDNPLSIYAKSEKTIVDGIVYFDRERDAAMRKKIVEEKSRIAQKMLGEKKAGMPTVPAQPSMEIMHTCSEHQHKHGLLIIDTQE